MENSQQKSECNVSHDIGNQSFDDKFGDKNCESKEDILTKPDDFQLKYRLHKKFDFKRRLAMNSSMDQASRKWARLEYNQSTVQVAGASSSTCSPSQIDNASEPCSSSSGDNLSLHTPSFKNTTNNDDEPEFTTNQNECLSSSSDVLYEPSRSIKQEEVSSAGPAGGKKTQSKKNKVQASCQVCDDVAAGFYCGAYICEACKVRSE